MNERLKLRETRAEVAALPWLHSIDLGNGVITPGRSMPNPLVLEVLDTLDFKGKKVLDVGCWDGLWSFEAEKRGAREVYATDDISQRSFQDTRPFELARRVLESRVKYFPNVNVEDLRALPDAKFDIVLFFGVIYHLRDPLRSLAILRNLLNDGGILVVQGEVWYDHRHTYATFHYSKPHERDVSNWWVPTVRCMEDWIESSFFRRLGTFCYANKSVKSKAIYVARWGLTKIFGNRSKLAGRAIVVAQAYRGKDPGWAFPDALFKEIDCNAYSTERSTAR